MYRGGGSKYGSHRGHKRGRGNDRGHGRGRGRGRGGHPPGLSGREIGIWHKAKSMGRKAENERIQRQEVNMTQKHEKYLTEMVGELNNAPPSLGASALPNNPLIGSSSSDRSHFSWAHSSAKNDPDDTASNEWLKSDLMSREKHNEMYKQMAEFRRKLPAHSMKETIVNLVSANQVVVISGETGCGKTTQVTQFILDDAIKNNRGSSCRIVCTQPRRISAISIAERVAEERGESVGDGSTGYQIRLESKLPREKGSILYCTTGVLLRWLIDDPDFSRASHVIIDEIHERSIHSDFLLIVVKDILSRRPDLRVVLMSATLNAEMFSQYFNNCPMLNIPGFTFPVQQHFLEEIIPTIHYNPAPSSSKKRYWRGRVDRNAAKNHEELWQEYLSLLRSRFSSEAMIECLENMDFEKIDYCLVEQLLVHIGLNMKEGAVLVFLPGWQDISTVHDLLKKNPFFSKDKFRILPLHSLMPTVNQRQIFDRPPPGVRKIVLSTSLAETSITIEDVVFVVNCGKTKEKNFDVEKQLESLLPVWISKASCKQRMGRAGRVQAGFCFNLFTEFHYEQMADYQEPEILRTPLEEICLQVKTLKQGMTEPFLSKALQPPSHEAIEQAITTLRQLNAFDTDENLTPLGYHLARLPVHPRIGKIILFGAIMSCLDPVLTIASSMGFKDPYVIPLNKEKQADECRRRLSKDTQSDHLTLINAYKEWESAERYRNGHQFCWDNFLSPSVLQMIKNMKTQFAEHLCQIGFISFKNPKEEEANYNSQNQGLIKAVLCAGLYPNVIFVSHPPQMARRPPRLSIQNDGRQLKVAIHPKSVNAEETSFRSNWMIYREKIKSSKIFIHDCSTVTPYSLLFFGGEITMARDEEQEIVAVDEWIKFNCRETVTNLVKKLREELDKLLEEKIRHPGLTLSLNKNCTKDRQSILIRAIIDLVTTE